MRLNFDLMTGFSLVPLQIFTIFGMIIGFLSGIFVIFLFIRRLVVGPEAEGVFTLFAILYMLVGLIILGLGIIGEYIGRIYLEVRRRPRFVIREMLEAGLSNSGILVFAYHDVGYHCLQELIAQNRNVLAVITHEDDLQEPAWFRSVAELARSHGIPVYTPQSVNTADWVERIGELSPDIIFSFYYRKLLCSEILAIPRLGAFNMHGSLLPKYRGRSPINWAILHGEKETGATLHYMVAQPDAGDIVDQKSVSIEPLDTARDVLAKVSVAARSVLARQLNSILQGSAPRRAQDEAQASYFGGRKPENGRIDWNSSAQDVFNLIRAVTHPYPGAFTEVDGKLLYIWWALPGEDAGGAPGEVLSISPLRVRAGQGSLELRTLQWEGAAEIDASAAHKLRAGQILGCDPPAANDKKTKLTVTAGKQ